MVSEMKFEFPPQIFVSQANVQVRRRFRYVTTLITAAKKTTATKDVVISLFCPPGLPVVRCFVPRETRLLMFFK